MSLPNYKGGIEMKIRKNSLMDLITKLVMVISFIVLFAEPKLTVLGIGLYLANLTFLWFLATIQTYYITERRK